MRLLVWLCLLAAPLSVSAQTPTDHHRAARWIAVLSSTTFDAATTNFDLRQGSHERNPLMRPFAHNAAALYAVKLGIGAVIAWRLDAVAKKKPDLANGVAIGITTAFAELGVRDLVDGFERKAARAQ